MIGEGLNCKGSISLMQCKHFMRFYDSRFCSDHKFIFLLFNQIQRHELARKISTKCVTNSKSFEIFTKLVNNANFKYELMNAIKFPNLGSSKLLTSKLMKLINTAGAVIPFGPVDRFNNRSKLYGMIQEFNLPTWFITMSPPDQDNHFAINLCFTKNSNNNEKDNIIDFNIFSDRNSEVCSVLNRIREVTKKPVIASEMFYKMVEAVVECLFGIYPSKKMRKTYPLSDDSVKNGHHQAGKI
jgi:hypothetical protein